ncbi:MAG: CHC2 zinc finger domain-containing protein, partial [Cyclobacteriaceae bacterium]
MISRETIEEVKNRVDIIDVISDFVTLKKSGQNYKALSPFANEKTPSFFVVPAKGIFKDFSSGKGG